VGAAARGSAGVQRVWRVPRVRRSADRAAWLHDVRSALEHNGIGWAMWDYSGSFGVVTKKDGKAVADEAVLQALGMKYFLDTLF
jgi:endoglucanase